MNDERILIESIMEVVKRCAEPFLLPVSNEAQTTDSTGHADRKDRPAPEDMDDGTVYTFRYVKTPSPRCKRVEISRRVFTALLAEAYANGSNETGGSFFGQMEDGVWYLIETSGPGYGALHSPTRHEMNNRFVNYQYRALSRIYARELVLLGFWHRHPGDFNRFSGLDDVVNQAYADVIGNGTVSMLLNFVPGPQLTCYYLDPEDGCYHLTPVVVDNKNMAKKGFLRYASPAELAERAQDMQDAMEGIA